MNTKITITLLAAASFLFAANVIKAQTCGSSQVTYTTTSSQNFLPKWNATAGCISNSSIFDNGNVGVGNSSPIYPFEISPVVTAGNLSSGGTWDVGLSVGSNGSIGQQSTNKHAVFGTIYANKDILFANYDGTTFNERMRIVSGGNVGIGTSAPTAKTQISGDFNAININANALVIDATLRTSVNGLDKAGILVTPDFNTTNSNVANTYGIKIAPTQTGIYTTTNGYGLHVTAPTVTSGFLTNSYAAVFNGGNVGIGNSAPNASALLDITSTTKGLLIPRVALTATNAAGPIIAPLTSLMVYNTATAGVSPNAVSPGYYYWNGVKWVAFGGSGGANWSLLGNAGTVATTNFIGTTDAIDLVVRTSNTEKMRVLSTGYIGIGTATPAERLDVGTGNMRFGGGSVGGFTLDNYVSGPDAGFLRFGDGTAWKFHFGRWSETVGGSKNTGTTGAVMTIVSAGNVGIGTTTPGVLLQVGNSGDGTVAKANAWNTFSDANFKTNVVTVKDALKKVLSLRGVTYNWITSGEPSIGFIAQEVDTVLHCIVLTDTTTGYKSLDYSKIVPVVVEAIKQLDSVNTTLALKDSIKDAKIQALEITDSITKVKLQSQDSVIAALKNQLITNDSLLQNQLNQLMATITNCCNRSQSLMDNGNNSNTKSMSIGSMPQSEATQIDVKLNDVQTVILEQNIPNPFQEETTINYTLPDNTVKAQMLFYNSQGKLIQSVYLVQKGKGQLNVFASDLSNGIYTYTLIVDGKIIDSKKMVRNK